MNLDTSDQAGGIPQLSEHYHQARKQYTLVCGVLLAYVLIGIGLPVDGKLIPNAAVSLKNPDALPVVFVALLLYFSYRLTIEWNQCDDRRRALLVSRIDFAVAQSLGVLSIAAYLIDRALQIGLGQIAAVYAPEVLFVTLWLLICLEAPLLFRAALDQVRGEASGRSVPGWIHRVDASMAPIFVALVCLAVLGLNIVVVIDGLTDFTHQSWYYSARSLFFGIICLGAFGLPKRMRDRLTPTFMRTLIGEQVEPRSHLRT